MNILIFLFCIALLGYTKFSWESFKINGKFNHVPASLDIINLGSTYAYYGLDYTKFNVNAYNMAIVPQYLNYDFILLKKYRKNLNDGATVLIILPDFVFCVDGKKINFNNLQYYLTLKAEEILGFNWKTYFYYRWVALKEPIGHGFKKKKEQWCGYEATDREKAAHADKRIMEWEKNLGIPSVNSGEVPLEIQINILKNIQIVEDIIDFCRLEKLKPYLLTMPQSEIMKKKISKECLNAYLQKPIEKIQKDKNVELLDYLNSDIFCSSKLYLNSDCLNETGRYLFTQEILKRLEINCGGDQFGPF